MTIAITAIVTGLVYFFVSLLVSNKKQEEIKADNDKEEVKNGLLRLAVRRLQIKRDVDAKPLDELVNRKRDGDDS